MSDPEFSGFGVSSGCSVFYPLSIENFWEGAYETREDADAGLASYTHLHSHPIRSPT